MSVLAAAALLVATAPVAGASVTGGKPVASGKIIMPMVGSNAFSRTSTFRTAASAGVPPLKYKGGNNHGVGVVTGQPEVYLVFWGSQWGTTGTDPDGNTTFSADASGEAPLLQKLFNGIGTNGEQWSGVLTQYCQGVPAGSTYCTAYGARVSTPTGAVFAGLWYDNAAGAPGTASYSQLAAEADRAAVHFGNSTFSANRNAQYFVVSPAGTHPDGFNTSNGQFCAYHSMTQTSHGDIAFTNMPYVTDMTWQCGANYVNSAPGGATDGVTMVAAHEYAETMTDPSAYAGWLDKDGEENADKCAWNGTGGSTGSQNVAFATGSLPVSATWGNDTGACEISRAPDPYDDFVVTATPATGTLYQTSSLPITVSTVTARNAAQQVELSVSGLPSGVHGAFGSPTVTSGASTTLTLRADANATAGTYTVTITGSGPEATHAATVKITVVAPKDFSVTPDATVTLQQAKTAALSVASAVVSGGADKVRVTLSGLPAGVTANGAPVTITAGTTAHITLRATPTARLGNATVTVTGTGALYAHSTTFTLTVTAADDFSLAASPNPVTIAPGASGTSTLSTTLTVGSAQTVALSASATGLTLRFSPASITSDSGSSTLTITVGARTRIGNYVVRITGRGASRTETTTLTVAVRSSASLHGSSIQVR